MNIRLDREEKKIAELTDEQAIPDFKSRTNCDLMRIVEDQVCFTVIPHSYTIGGVVGARSCIHLNGWCF